MPTPRICCVDASIIVRLLIDRADRPVQTLWLSWQEEAVMITAPALLLYEVTNALYQQQRQGVFSEQAVELMIATARLLPIRLVADSGLHREAHRIASDLGLPATYDAHYLATAVRDGAMLWTSDKKLVTSIGGKLGRVRYVPRKDEAANSLR